MPFVLKSCLSFFLLPGLYWMSGQIIYLLLQTGLRLLDRFLFWTVDVQKWPWGFFFGDFYNKPISGSPTSGSPTLSSHTSVLFFRSMFWFLTLLLKSYNQHTVYKSAVVCVCVCVGNVWKVWNLSFPTSELFVTTLPKSVPFSGRTFSPHVNNVLQFFCSF